MGKNLWPRMTAAKLIIKVTQPNLREYFLNSFLIESSSTNVGHNILVRITYDAELVKKKFTMVRFQTGCWLTVEWDANATRCKPKSDAIVTRCKPKSDDEKEEEISSLNGFADYKAAHVCPHRSWPPSPNVYVRLTHKCLCTTNTQMFMYE